MATTIDELIVQIRADTRGLQQSLDRVERQLDKSFPTGASAPQNQFAASLKGIAGGILSIGSAMAAINITRDIARVGDEFEALAITLNRIYGSAEAGSAALDEIKVFAQTTPFQLEDVTKAFIQLRSNGIEPNTEMLTIFGDAASAAMNPLEAFNSLIRITQRAAGGGLGLEELEQLVTQGIPVYTILQREIGKSRLELSELGKTADGARIIMEALQRGLQKDFGGIMAERMGLLSTKSSNLGIALKGLADEIYRGGLGQALKGMVDDLTGAVDDLRQTLAEPARRQARSFARSTLGAQEMAALERSAAMPEGGTTYVLGREVKVAPIDEMLADLRAKYQGELDRLRSFQQSADDPNVFIVDGLRQRINDYEAQIARADRAVNAIAAYAEQFVEPAAPDPLAAITAPLAKSLMAGGGGGGDTGVSSTKLLENVAALQKVLEKTVTDAEQLQEQFDMLGTVEGMRNAQGELFFTGEEIQRIRDYLQGLKDDLEDDAFQDAYGDIQKIVESTVTPAETLQAKIKELQAILASGDQELIKKIFGDLDTAEVMARLGEELDDLKNKGNEAAETFSTEMAQAITTLSHQFTNEFVNSLMEGQNALDAFKNFARNIVQQIIATFLQMAIVNQILNSVFGLTGTNALPTISLGKRASGGAMSGSRPYLVGERGPELFVPHTAGTMRNSTMTANMGGGAQVVVNQSLNFSTGVVPTVRAEIRSMLPMINDMTKASVLEATRRGGNYRKGLLGA